MSSMVLQGERFLEIPYRIEENSNNRIFDLYLPPVLSQYEK